MLIIHQGIVDPSISFLQVLYEGLEDARCLCGSESRNQVNDILFHLLPGEPVMLLGHGTDAGLFRLEGGEYRCYIGRSMAYCLRKHPIIGIWCHANKFAEQLHLHGVFTGMIISEYDEALQEGIHTSPAELEQENRLFASTLSELLRTSLPYSEIPARMREAVGANDPAVRQFNYNSFYYL